MGSKQGEGANRQQMSSNWWRLTGSNRSPPACKAGALPDELNPQVFVSTRLTPAECLSEPQAAFIAVVGLVGLEPTTPALSTRCSDQLSYRPVRRAFSGVRFLFYFLTSLAFLRFAFFITVNKCGHGLLSTAPERR